MRRAGISETDIHRVSFENANVVFGLGLEATPN
jgi:hypothetical protein